MHYNPYVETILVVTYNVEDASKSTLLYHYQETTYMPIVIGADLFDKVEIDGVDVSITDLDTAHGGYQLSVGEHTVKYTLKVTELVQTLFYDCTKISSVMIPEGVTSIGGSVFQGCSGLTSVLISNTVTNISGGFRGCKSLNIIIVDSNNSVYDSRNNCNAIIETATNTLICGSNSTIIPNTVTSIGSEAFESRVGLTSITIPNSVTSIDYSAFRDCSGLTSVTIGNSVTNISDYAFSSCSGLTSVTIGNSVTSIGGGAFYNCKGLTSVIIPNSVTSINDYAFWNCTSLTGITSLATTAPTISSNTFRNVKTNGTLTVPSGSSGYDVWMQNANYYLGYYNWTKVEQ